MTSRWLHNDVPFWLCDSRRDVTWMWRYYGIFKAFLWPHTMTKIWHLWFYIGLSDQILPESFPYCSCRFFATDLWRLCIQSGDQILRKSSTITSDRLFLLSVYGICDECASCRLTKFYSSPILKIRIAFFSTGFWRLWIGLRTKVLPKSIRKSGIAFF